MRLLLDEMHSPAAARALSRRGHRVGAVAADPKLRGMADAELLHHAAEAGLAIVTENVPDFAVLNSQWVASAVSHAGLIFTDPIRFNRRTAAYPASLIAALDHFLRQPPIEGQSWTWWLQPRSHAAERVTRGAAEAE